MHSSSSPPVLYLGDDDDDDYEQNQYFETNRSLVTASSSNDMNISRKKRKLTNENIRINPSISTWSKRQRNDHYQQQISQNFIDNDPDPEPILLDPDEYIIEEPDPQSFRSFDWTIQPTLPPIIPTKIPSSPMKTLSRVSTIPTSNVNNTTKRSLDNPKAIPVPIPNDKFIQQQKKTTPIQAPRPSLAHMPLPLPKPASSIVRLNTQRGRPLKNSRIPHTPSTSPPLLIRQRSEPQILPQTPKRSSSTATTVPSSPINNSTSEIRRQILNGTGIFSAFHDSKYYRCNICKFKSVTSSTLLQHLFTHMFFCDHCSFYTYSHYNLSQHLFEKHNINLLEEVNESLNPKIFDLLYVTRCPDGTFALCMDSSLNPTNKTSNTDQRLIISSAAFNDPTPKKKPLKKKEEDNDIVLIPEKRDVPNQRPLTRSKLKEKVNENYILMKHRSCYSFKKSPCLHSLTLEYNICRENTIRHRCQTEKILKRRKFLTKFSKTRLIDEIANCLRTIVNQIVDTEENSDQSSLICTLPNDILSSILSKTNLNTLTNLLKLNNKYDEWNEQNNLYKSEHLLRENREHMFILSSPDINHSEQLIVSSLHSSMTNGDSIFTQAKLDNNQRYLPTNSHKLVLDTQLNKPNPKVPEKIQPKPVIPKPSRSLPTNTSKLSSPSVIILD